MSSLKYIGFGGGFVSLLASFLFFGRLHDTYTLLFTGGLLASVIFYLIILFRPGTVRSKWICTGILLGMLATTWVLRPLLIKTSFRLYLYTHQTEVKEMNQLLVAQPGTLKIRLDEIEGDKRKLTAVQEKRCFELFQQLNVYLIRKDSTSINYELWGFLDVRVGLTYYLDGNLPLHAYRSAHLVGNWYY